MKFANTSSSTSAPRPWVFLLLLCEIKVWLQSRAPFADLIFQKRAEILSFLRFLFLRALATVSCTFCRPHLPKVLRTCQFFGWFLSEIELSSLSRTHFANRIYQKCSDADSFSDFYIKSSSRYSLVHMWPTPSSKTAPNVTVFDILKCKSSSRYSPAHVLSTTSADWGPKPRKQRPYFGNHGTEATLPEKNTGFRARESFQAWIHAFPTCSTSQLLDDDDDEDDDDDDDVVDMTTSIVLHLPLVVPNLSASTPGTRWWRVCALPSLLPRLRESETWNQKWYRMEPQEIHVFVCL